MSDLNDSEHLNYLLFILQKPPELRRLNEVDHLLQMTINIELFKQLLLENPQTNVHRECCKYMEHEYFAPGAQIFAIDTIADKFYIVLSGEVAIYARPIPQNQELPGDVRKPSRRSTGFKSIEKRIKPDKMVQVKVMLPGECFGELALINNRPRLATIVALTKVHCAMLRKREFKKILQRVQEQRQLREMGFFASVPLFNNWNLNLIRYMYLNSRECILRRGQVVFTAGQPCLAFYIIKSGDFQVFVCVHLKITQIQTTFPHKLVKSLAIISHPQIIALEDMLEGQHPYSCICVSAEGELIAVSKDDFYNKVYLSTTSKQYVDEQTTIQKAYLRGRSLKLQHHINLHWLPKPTTNITLFGDRPTTPPSCVKVEGHLSSRLTVLQKLRLSPNDQILLNKSIYVRNKDTLEDVRFQEQEYANQPKYHRM